MIKITAFGHLHCGHCANVFKFADKVKNRIHNAKIEKIDITRHPHILLRHKLLYIPSLIVNDKYVFHGIPKEHKFLERIRSIER